MQALKKKKRKSNKIPTFLSRIHTLKVIMYLTSQKKNKKKKTKTGGAPR